MALQPRYNTIIAGPARRNDPQTQEAVLADSSKPGMLVQLDAAGKMIKHKTKGGGGLPLILQENYVGGGDIRDGVMAGTTGMAIMAETGVDYHMMVKASEVLLLNDALVSNGDGTLIKSTAPETDAILFYSREKFTVGETAQLVKVRAGRP